MKDLAPEWLSQVVLSQSATALMKIQVFRCVELQAELFVNALSVSVPPALPQELSDSCCRAPRDFPTLTPFMGESLLYELRDEWKFPRIQNVQRFPLPCEFVDLLPESDASVWPRALWQA